MIDALKRISAALGLLVIASAQVEAQSEVASPNQITADAVAASLRSNAQLNRQRIAIETREGTVLLTGTVSNATLKAEALNRARLAPGVATVVDRLQVVGDSRVRQAQFQPNQMPQTMRGRYLGANGLPTDTMMEGVQMPAGIPGAAPAIGVAPTEGVMTPPYTGPIPEGAAGGSAPASTPGAPNYAWPSYAPAGNFSAVGYPTAYPWQAWPNIGPFYPYPEVPLDWRAVTLRWDDGIWWLDFRKHYTRPFFTPYPFGLFAY